MTHPPFFIPWHGLYCGVLHTHSTHSILVMDTGLAYTLDAEITALFAKCKVPACMISSAPA